MEIQHTVILGVVSGVGTSALLFLIKEFWVRTLIPWYQNVQYKGADVSGSWYAERTESAPDSTPEVKSSFSLMLNQNAHVVTGSMLFSTMSTGKHDSVAYNLKGEYWDGYLSITCRSKDRRSMSHGSMFLKHINNGSGLLGSFSFRHAFEDKVISIPMGIDRKNKELAT